MFGDSLARGNGAGAAAVFAVANSLEALIGGWLFLRLRDQWRRPVSFAPALAVAGVVAALASTTIVAVVLVRQANLGPGGRVGVVHPGRRGVLAVARWCWRAAPGSATIGSHVEKLRCLSPQRWRSRHSPIWPPIPCRSHGFRCRSSCGRRYALNQRWVAVIVAGQAFAISWSVAMGLGAFEEVATKPVGPALAQALVAVLAFTALVLSGSSIERRTAQAMVEQERQLLSSVIEDAVAGILLVSLEPAVAGPCSVQTRPPVPFSMPIPLDVVGRRW